LQQRLNYPSDLPEISRIHERDGKIEDSN
jgi:hypothetical protein